MKIVLDINPRGVVTVERFSPASSAGSQLSEIVRKCVAEEVEHLARALEWVRKGYGDPLSPDLPESSWPPLKETA